MVFVKGQVSVMKGKHHSPKSKKKMSQAKKGTIPWNKGIKSGISPWNKGKDLPTELKKRISETKRRQAGGVELPCTYCGKKKYYRPSKAKNKTGNHFCSLEHQQIYQFRENNPSWKKDGNITYKQKHSRVRSARGNAIDYECAMKDKTCKGNNEWASISHNANNDVQDYIPLCRSHHRRYDLRSKKYASI